MRSVWLTRFARRAPAPSAPVEPPRTVVSPDGGLGDGGELDAGQGDAGPADAGRVLVGERVVPAFGTVWGR